MKVKRKAQTLNAIQFTGLNFDEIIVWVKPNFTTVTAFQMLVPEHIDEMRILQKCNKKTCICKQKHMLNFLRDDMQNVYPTNWIVKDVDERYYVYSEESFNRIFKEDQTNND